MAFLQSCFIYKNTPELRQYLDKIGYKYGGKASKFEQLYLYCSLDKYFECNSFPARYHRIIDCGANEDLFLALASLNDDNDKNQWFIYDGNNPKDYHIQNGDWYMCIFEHNIPNGHKATVEELIEHFK